MSLLQQLEEQYNDVLLDDRPSSLVSCAMESGKRSMMSLPMTAILPEVYKEYQDKMEELSDLEDQMMEAIAIEDAKIGYSNRNKRVRSPRKVKAIRPYYIDDDGLMHILHPTETFWYKFYVNNPHAVIHSKKFIKKFRRRFRMPYEEYQRLLGEVSNHEFFGQWQRRDATGAPPSPIGLLLLGSLRYMGRGLTFDDLEEDTSIGEETHRQFFHRFIHFGSTYLYPLEVRMPRTAEEFATHQIEYTIGGLTGCGFSTDGTHVLLWNCSHNLRQAHLGFKESHPARAYNLSTNHRRQILYTTEGHPSRWNDKTLALFDELLGGVHNGDILQDVVFELLRWGTGINGRRIVLSDKYRGAWCLVDNGYHKWSCTQAPAKVNILLSEQRLSDWIESFRKDAECVFGILKGRWRVLKTGIRLQDVTAADRIWKTCCALHNRLLEVDGLSQPWDGSLGQNDVREMREHAPFALRRLTDEQVRNFGSRQHERDSDECIQPLVDQDTVRPLVGDFEAEDEAEMSIRYRMMNLEGD